MTRAKVGFVYDKRGIILIFSPIVLPKRPIADHDEPAHPRGLIIICTVRCSVSDLSIHMINGTD